MHVELKTREKLKKYPNVTGAGYGFKVSKGKITSEKSLIVFVSRKIPLSALSTEEIIPKYFDGFTTDIRVLKVKALADDPSMYRPAPGGCSIGHFSITAGTLGSWVLYKDRYCILSNNHVLANSNEGSIGDRVLQPGPYDGGKFTVASLFEFKEIFLDSGNPSTCEFSQILEFLMNFLAGLFGRNTRVKFVKSAEVNYVDAALAEALEPISEVVKTEILEIGNLSSRTTTPELGLEVKKRGRTTRLTNGFISAIEVEVKVSGYGPSEGTATFQDQVIVETKDNSDFSAGGDSGSLVVAEYNSPTGLLFAGGEDDSGRKITVINNIDRVLEAFPGLEFV